MTSSLVDKAIYYMHQYWIDIGDPRTAHYPMVSDRVNLIIIEDNIDNILKIGERRTMEDCNSFDHLLAAGKEDSARIYERPKAVLTKEYNSNIQYSDGDNKFSSLSQNISTSRLWA